VDNLCHTLVGAALAESGLKRRTRGAVATLLIGANLPDVDAVAMFSGSGLGFRRGLTHGMLAQAVLPLLLTALVLLWYRLVPRHGPAPRPRVLLGLATLAVLTHPFLDWLNTYGMRWLAPFSGRWFYGDAVFIVDPWLLLVLAGGVLLARLRWAKGHPAAGRPARVALALAGTYIAVMLAVTTVGRWVAARDLGLATAGPRDLMVGPVFAKPYAREVIAVDQDAYRIGWVDWWPSPRLVLSKERIPIGDLVAARRGAEYNGPARQMLAWARFPFCVTEGDALWLDDLRYAWGGRSWAAVRLPVAAGP
jgi:inner membrane protein